MRSPRRRAFDPLISIPDSKQCARMRCLNPAPPVKPTGWDVCVAVATGGLLKKITHLDTQNLRDTVDLSGTDLTLTVHSTPQSGRRHVESLGDVLLADPLVGDRQANSFGNFLRCWHEAHTDTESCWSQPNTPRHAETRPPSGQRIAAPTCTNSRFGYMLGS